MPSKVSLDDVKYEISLIQKSNPKLTDDAAFVYWFLQAYLVDSQEMAKKALTGEGNDKSLDAILIDDKIRQANVIQGKLRESSTTNEKRSDVLAFADIATLPWAQPQDLATFYDELAPLARQKFEELVYRVRKKKYGLRLFYVTTGRCSDTIVGEAKQRTLQADGPAEISIFDHQRTMVLFMDYLSDAAPPVHTLSLSIIPEGTVQNEGEIHRYDPERGIESWVFSASGEELANIYSAEGNRLFARNIRGYLGSSDINDAIADTIRDEPHNFWYYNNGITIVCNDAREDTHGGQHALVIDGAQVINGQQTIRTLSRSKARNVNVLARVVKIPRNPGDDLEYDRLVNSIVRANNWQNYIYPSDLVSNDYIQIFLQKEFRKRGYHYIRKRMNRSEAKSYFGSQGYFQIDKKEMAQAVAACLFDPVVVRRGKEGLFQDPYYKRTFGSHSISFYLSKYWLMKQVQYAARGRPEWSYAKWLVLNFLWKQLDSHLGSGNAEGKFRYASEHKLDNLSPLAQAITGVFKSALMFYRLNRGKGEKATDVSNFFKLSKLDSRFIAFWNSAKNPHRVRVDDELDKFRAKLESLEIEQ